MLLAARLIKVRVKFSTRVYEYKKKKKISSRVIDQLLNVVIGQKLIIIYCLNTFFVVIR